MTKQCLVVYFHVLKLIITSVLPDSIHEPGIGRCIYYAVGVRLKRCSQTICCFQENTSLPILDQVSMCGRGPVTVVRSRGQ